MHLPQFFSLVASPIPSLVSALPMLTREIKTAVLSFSLGN